MLNDRYFIWVEIGANKHRIPDREYFSGMFDRCMAAGIGSIILSVKDTTGFGIYKSAIVPHYSKYCSILGDDDYLDVYVRMAHEKGLKLHAAIDVFSEGKADNKNPLSPAYINTEWQTRMYGIDSQGKGVIRSIADMPGIRTAGSIDDFDDIFVNPAMEDVRNYELSVIRELVNKYDIDGITLDRARFVGLGSDFSDCTRKKFEEYLGSTVVRWPEDIYRLDRNGGDISITYGPLFGRWIAFRAGVIRNFVADAAEIVRAAPKKVEFLDYAGSWYPLYHLVGANWASKEYKPAEYPWADASEYSGTGYAELLDTLLSGFYYPDITVEDAAKNGQPAFWYSVEGSGDMVKRVVNDAAPYVGSIFAQQYEGRPDLFRKAIDMCFNKSCGCMIFDLSYIEQYGWWKDCDRVSL